MILKYSKVRERKTGREGIVIDHMGDSTENSFLVDNVVEFRDPNGYPVNKLCRSHELEIIDASPLAGMFLESPRDPLEDLVELQEQCLTLHQLLKRAGRLATAVRGLMATPLAPDGYTALETVLLALDEYENGVQEVAIKGTLSNWEIG